MRKTGCFCKIYTAKDFPLPEPPVPPLFPEYVNVLLVTVAALTVFSFLTYCVTYLNNGTDLLNKDTEVLIAGNKKIIEDLRHSLDLSPFDNGKDSLNSVVAQGPPFLDANAVSSAVETITDVVTKT